MGLNVLTNIQDSTGGSPNALWNTIPGLPEQDIDAKDLDSVFIVFLTVPVLATSDATADYRLEINGDASESPVLSVFSDNASGSETGNVTIAFAIDDARGLVAGSNTINPQWKQLTGTPAKDTSRDASLLILEFTDGDAVIKYDLGLNSSAGVPGTWGTLYNATGVNITGGTNVIMLLSNNNINLAGDHGIEFQFGVNATQEGAVTNAWVDNIDEGTGWSGVHCKTGLSGGGNSFQLYMQAATGSPIIDPNRRRTFQVVEILGDVELITSIISSAAYAATSGWDGDTTLTDDLACNVNDRFLAIANVTHDDGSPDSTAGSRITADGVQIGADVIDFCDLAGMVGRACLASYVTGLQGTKTFQLEWDEVQSSVDAAATNRSLFVLKWAGVSYQIDGVTRDVDGAILGTCECYLFKDGGSSLTFIGHTQSDANGDFSFTGVGDTDPNYVVYAAKAETPHVFDVSNYNLTPDDGTNSVDLYLRSDADKSETPVSSNLRLRSDADKEAAAVEIATTLRGYLQRSDVEVGTTLRGYLYQESSIGTVLRSYLQLSDAEIATALRGYLTAIGVETETALRAYLTALGVETDTTLRAYLAQAAEVATDLRAYLTSIGVEVGTTLRGYLSQNVAIGSTLRGYLQALDVEVGTTLRAYITSQQVVGTQLSAYLSAVGVETDSTLRGHLSENVTIGTTLRGHLSQRYTIETSLRAYLQSSGVEVGSSLRGHLSEHLSVATDLRAYLFQIIEGEVATTLTGYLQKKLQTIETDLRAYLQRSDIEISTTLRAYLIEGAEESTDLRAYLSKLGIETSTTLSAYLIGVERPPHHCYKAVGRDKFVVSPREKFVASPREKFGSTADTCPFKED